VDETGALHTDVISREVSKGRSVLLDVRTAQELAVDGYAAGSTHFDLARLQAGQLPDVPTDTTIYVYCKIGGRAGQAMEILEANGFTDVTNIGGLVDWETAGGEVLR
jgi:rhodanese-related sulfurtransferase